MDAVSQVAQRRKALWLDAEAGDFEAFRACLAEAAVQNHWPLATTIERTVPIYDGDVVRSAAPDRDARRDLMAEWANVLADGAGIIVIKNGVSDIDAIDRATAVFEDIITREKAGGRDAGDHFAKPGSNDRIWNALEKHALEDPESFARYYASDAIAMASEAWLGRGYQLTAQVNRVNPGGTAQTPHRDYHLGFMAPEAMTHYPAHIHRISPVLTLQGAVAHCDMPLASGPTLFLPGSQRFFEGYIAFARAPFQDHFAKHHVQLALEKGDTVFFNPAVMHGAGANVSDDIFRMANLLQVSSAFGRAMESVNRTRMACALYPVLLAAADAGHMGKTALANVIAASAEGYPFPTNLDKDVPITGLVPQTEAEYLHEALAARRPA
ncbi:MAG: phytanoyl-CoA dioxygenase family protein, partial [Pseudomonadota bacterium]